MRIGELAKQAGVSIQTIRFYERRRLLPPPPRTVSGYRRYSEKDLEIVVTVKRMQHFGFTLKEVRRVLQLYAIPLDKGKHSEYSRGSHECLREVVEIGKRKLNALNEQIRSLIAVRDELEKTLHQYQSKIQPSKKRAEGQAAKKG